MMSPKFIEPKTTVYDHTHIEEIRITADKLDLKLRNFEKSVKESNKGLLAPILEVFLSISIFSTTNFKPALSFSAGTWESFYIIIAFIIFLRLCYECLNKIPAVRKKIFKKFKLITSDEFINDLKDENKKVN